MTYELPSNVGKPGLFLGQLQPIFILRSWLPPGSGVLSRQCREVASNICRFLGLKESPIGNLEVGKDLTH